MASCSFLNYISDLFKSKPVTYPKWFRDMLNDEYKEIHRLEKEIKRHKRNIEDIKKKYNAYENF